MSSDESSNNSNSSSNSSNSDEVANHNQMGNINQRYNEDYNRRYERHRQRNRLVDRMMDEMMMSNPVEFFQMLNQVPRAPRVLVERDREDGHNHLWNDYFADPQVYPSNLFRRRFRMNKHVFLRIVQTLSDHNEFFQQRPNATGRLGASSLQKCTAAIRLLAYSTAADSVDDYLRISASLARDSLQHFVEGVVSYFSVEYLRRPTEADLERLLRVGEQREFLGMMGSIDCRAPLVNYVVNGHQYNMGYYLTDGIYPIWAAFIPTTSIPQNEKETLFAQLQESRRKDVERAFGVLQARFAIIRHPALARDVDMLGKIMIACIIIHNMIVEDERDTHPSYYDPREYDEIAPPSTSRRNTAEPFQFNNSNNRPTNLETYMSNRVRVRDEHMHRALKADLVEHLWLKYGDIDDSD